MFILFSTLAFIIIFSFIVALCLDLTGSEKYQSIFSNLAIYSTLSLFVTGIYQFYVLIFSQWN